MSNTQMTSLICNKFGGIQRKESSFSGDKITCSDCQNVELFFTNQDNGVGIRTSKGNVAIHDFVSDKIQNPKVIGLFESNQDTNTVFAYVEDDNKGYLFHCDLVGSTYEQLDVSLTATGYACGTDFSQGYDNFFVFTNGKELVYLYTDTTEVIKTLKILDVNNENFAQKDGFKDGLPLDVDGNSIYNDISYTLGLAVYDNRIWLFNGHTLYYSFKGLCTDFRQQDTGKPEASAGYIELAKPITAIKEYLGRLAVFHKDSSALVSTDSLTVYAVEDESPGGCAGYNSLVFHGTDLYFYDDTKKGVFSFAQIVNGDKTLTQNMAEDIQEELMQISSSNVNKIRATSVITEDRNEVWFILPISQDVNRTTILVFDYPRGEWLKRYSNQINCVLVYEADLYSGGNKFYKEYQENSFDGEYINSFYRCSIFNYGTDNTLKITKFPPRLTVDTGETCDFWIEYVRNYDNNKAPKRKNIRSKNAGKALVYDTGMCYDTNTVYSFSANATAKLPSTTFKALEMNFQTENVSQGFCIKNIEFSKLKVKQV